MFNFLKRNASINYTYNLDDVLEMIHKLKLEIKEIREEIAKIDIKAMEAQKSYRAKLKRLTGDIEEKETETNKNTSVFLSPHGNPI